MCWAGNLILNDRHRGCHSPAALQNSCRGVGAPPRMQPSSGGNHTQLSMWEELDFPGHIHGVYTISIPRAQVGRHPAQPDASVVLYPTAYRKSVKP